MDFTRQDALMQKTRQKNWTHDVVAERDAYRAQATKLVEALIELGHGDVVDGILEGS